MHPLPFCLFSLLYFPVAQHCTNMVCGALVFPSPALHVRAEDITSTDGFLPAFLTESGGLNSGFMLAHCTSAALGVCVCVVVCLYGSVGVWEYRCMSVWEYGCMSVWVGVLVWGTVAWQWKQRAAECMTLFAVLSLSLVIPFSLLLSPDSTLSLLPSPLASS